MKKAGSPRLGSARRGSPDPRPAAAAPHSQPHPQPHPQPQPRHLAAHFDPRANSVNALRLVLAVLVLVAHAFALQDVDGMDPVGDWTGGPDLGGIAVDGFFALSGFLIVRSYLTSPSLGRYLWRRCLRILPGFWVCLLVSAFVLFPVAQLIQFGTLSGFPLTGELSATSYVVDNAALLIRQFQVRGLFDGGVVNGSLHTLFYEFVCYLGVAALGVLGVLRTHRWGLLVVAAALWAVSIFEVATAGALTAGQPARSLLLRFGLMFVAGAVAQLWAHRVPFGRRWAAGAVVLLLVALQGAVLAPDGHISTLVYLVIAPPAVAYLVLYAGASPRLAGIGRRRDLSYGLYVYSWPVQALLLLVGAAGWPVLLYAAVALAVALGMAVLSWVLVESPALALKDWSPRRRQSVTTPGRSG